MANHESQVAGPIITGSCSYQFGRFSLLIADDGNMTLFSDGHAVGLTTGELTILRLLLENRGQFVKTKVLLERVTQSPRASENVVHGAVRELRRTLHDAELIKTERTKGYCFTGKVTVNAQGINKLVDPKIAVAAANAASTGSNALSRARTAAADRRKDPFFIVASLVSAAVLLLPFGLAFAGGS